jgi:hypothetical protein
MAIISFSKADILRSQNLENDKWYSWKIVKVEGPVKNAKEDGYNYKVTFSLIDHSTELNGKEVERVFSNKAISMMVPLIVASKGLSQDEFEKNPFQIDTDELLGKNVDGKYTIEMYQGQPNGRVETYVAYKKATSASTGF